MVADRCEFFELKLGCELRCLVGGLGLTPDHFREASDRLSCPEFSRDEFDLPPKSEGIDRVLALDSSRDK